MSNKLCTKVAQQLLSSLPRMSPVRRWPNESALLVVLYGAFTSLVADNVHKHNGEALHDYSSLPRCQRDAF